MEILRRLVLGLLVVVGTLPLAGPASAQPGIPVPVASEAGDQRPGSILVYNVYTSDAGNPAAQDTRLALTNGSGTTAVKVRVFLVDGAAGSVTASDVCLAPHQTRALSASSLRAGSTGYAVAVAIDGNGCPVVHNDLSGQAQVRFASGFKGALEAVGIAAIQTPACVPAGPPVNLAFNGSAYNLLPATIALGQIPSRADVRTLVALNRIGGNLGTGASALGPVNGTLYDDVENAFLYGLSGAGPQVLSELSDAFPVTAPPFETILDPGRTGWTKLFNVTATIGYLGSAFFLPGPVLPLGELPASRETVRSGEGGRHLGAVNLLGITLTLSTFVMPVQAPAC